MPNKTIAELKMGDRVIPKDASYGHGVLVGINKKTEEYLIGYKAGDPKFSGSWTNSGGKFIASGVYVDNIKDYSHFYFAPANLELHNNEIGQDGLTVGDDVEIYYDADGNLALDAAKRDKKQTRKGKIVGFNDNGSPLIYIEKSDLKEVGTSYAAGRHRNIHEMFDDKLDTTRPAFFDGTNGLSNGWLKQIKKGKKVKTMSNNTSGGSDRPAFFDTIKSDMKDAGYRVASKQMVDGVRAGILKAMENKGQSSDRIQALADLLNTEFGKSLISLGLGLGLNYLPGLSNDERVQKLSEEFRVNGFAVAGNAVADVAMQAIIPVVTQTLSQLPPVEKQAVRVSEQTKVDTKEEETEQKEEAKPKTMTA